MGLIAPPTYIAPPGITGHRFGLFSVANMPEPSGRWNLGVEWEPLEGGPAQLRPADCVDDYSQQYIEPSAPPVAREGIPFVVAAGYVCKAQSRPIEEAEERARLALAGGEERAVERALMNSDLMGNEPGFAGSTVLGGGSAVSVIEAFSLLESSIAAEGHSAGVIHLPRSLTPAAYNFSLMQRMGQQLETVLGNLVAAGSGYEVDNVGPTGVSPEGAELWVYATPPVTIRRGQVFTQPDRDSYVDKSTNDVAIIAQREYLVTFDGPTFAVLVDPEA